MGNYITDLDVTMANLIERSDSGLFGKVLPDSHCLNQIRSTPIKPRITDL